MGIYTIKDTGGEPNTWKVTHFANISGSEEFLIQLVVEMPELVDASVIYEPERQRLKEAIAAIPVDGLMPAFEDLKRIRASVNQEIPELNRRQLYETFTVALWRSYKDLMQRAAKLLEPEIGFLFQEDSKFEAGLITWGKKRPVIAQAVAPYLRKQRTTWQNELGAFRNYLEHRNDADPARFESRYAPTHAEMVFGAVWRTIADILAMLVSLHLPPGTTLLEIPPEQRHPAMPRRFCFEVQGIPTPGGNA
ncbi:MAG: hypothetical protein ABSG79_23350 [Bryobacteraceae bacterium]|jgi:hypothetical protein